MEIKSKTFKTSALLKDVQLDFFSSRTCAGLVDIEKEEIARNKFLITSLFLFQCLRKTKQLVIEGVNDINAKKKLTEK